MLFYNVVRGDLNISYLHRYATAAVLVVFSIATVQCSFFSFFFICFLCRSLGILNGWFSAKHTHTHTLKLSEGNFFPGYLSSLHENTGIVIITIKKIITRQLQFFIKCAQINHFFSSLRLSSWHLLLYRTELRENVENINVWNVSSTQYSVNATIIQNTCFFCVCYCVFSHILKWLFHKSYWIARRQITGVCQPIIIHHCMYLWLNFFFHHIISWIHFECKNKLYACFFSVTALSAVLI